MKRTTIILPEPLRSRAKRYAKTQGMTLAELIRVTLAERIARGEARDPIFEAPVYKGGLKRGSTRHDIFGPRG